MVQISWDLSYCWRKISGKKLNQKIDPTWDRNRARCLRSNDVTTDYSGSPGSPGWKTIMLSLGHSGGDHVFNNRLLSKHIKIIFLIILEAIVYFHCQNQIITHVDKDKASYDGPRLYINFIKIFPELSNFHNHKLRKQNYFSYNKKTTGLEFMWLIRPTCLFDIICCYIHIEFTLWFFILLSCSFPFIYSIYFKIFEILFAAGLLVSWTTPSTSFAPSGVTRFFF